MVRDLVFEDFNYFCVKNKGECSYICVFDNVGKVRCLCFLDLMLKLDDKICVDLSICFLE